MVDKYDDSVLIAAQNGQPWALRIIYENLAPRIQGYLRAKGASEPEDLTSEVFLVLFTKIETITGGVNGLNTLAFSIAHARMVDDVRKQTRRPDVTAYDPDRDSRAVLSAEDQNFVNNGTARAVSLLKQLPNDQREVLALRLIADLSVEQTAIAIGRSVGAVKQLQRRALLSLKNSAQIKDTDG